MPRFFADSAQDSRPRASALPLFAARTLTLALVAGVCLSSVSAQQDQNPNPGTPRAVPVSPAGEPGAPSTAIRATPVEDGPAAPAEREDLMVYADLMFSHKQYALAGRQYRLFLEEHKDSPNAVAAWFRLGECYLREKQVKDAEVSFQHVIDHYKSGPFVGSAAYRLAALRYNAEKHREALPYFETAIKNVDSAEVRLQAQYFQARCLQAIGKHEESLAAFVKVTEVEENNPFLERARLEVARSYFDLDEKEKALAEFKKLAEVTQSSDIRTESLAKAGLLAAELGQTAESNELLRQTMDIPGGHQAWRDTAQVGLLYNHFKAEEYEKVIDLYRQKNFNPPESAMAKALLWVGHSFRITGDLTSAIEVYGDLSNKYPATREGMEAGYRRLQCYYIQDDGGLPVYVDRYLERQKSVDAESPYIDLALFMKAEYAFAKQDYPEAAKAYAAIRASNIDDSYRPGRLFNLGWSRIEAAQFPEGIQTLTLLIEDHPNHALTPKALAKRADAYQQLSNHESALADYRMITEQYPESDVLEYAYLGIAEIYSAQGDIENWLSAWANLLVKFPETKVRPDAKYWIGKGLFAQKRFEDCIAPLNEARELDKKNYYERATRRIILAHRFLENVDELKKEVAAFMESDAKEPVPKEIFIYLGEKLFAREDYEGAATYLSQTVTPENAIGTDPRIWDMLGQSLAATDAHKEAIASFENYLEIVNRPTLRATGYVNKGRSHLAAGDPAAAKADAEEALRLQKEGRTNANARLLLGDAYRDQGDPESAAKEYLIVSQIFVDPMLTPLALDKAVQAYEAAGDKAKAADLKGQLQDQYPDYEPGEGDETGKAGKKKPQVTARTPAPA